MDIELITSPISENYPCGCDIRAHNELKYIYFEIKDERNNARRHERSAEILTGDEIVALWQNINRVSVKLLSHHTKDLELLCWLIEAQLRICGFAGLNDTLEIVINLIEKYWDDLHSVGSTNNEDRIAPLVGLSGSGDNGVLLQALRLTPLVPSTHYGKYGLWDYQRAQRQDGQDLREKLYQAALAVGKDAMSAHHDTVLSCIKRFSYLSSALEPRCTENALLTAPLNSILQEAAYAIREMNGAEDNTIVLLEPQIEPSADVPQLACEPDTNQKIHSREEALKLLFAVARYFQTFEPHSPIAPVLDTLVMRSRMNFQELLTELLPDHAMCVSILTAAGIHTRQSDK